MVVPGIRIVPGNALTRNCTHKDAGWKGDGLALHARREDYQVKPEPTRMGERSIEGRDRNTIPLRCKLRRMKLHLSVLFTLLAAATAATAQVRSEERRVGKEGR